MGGVSDRLPDGCGGGRQASSRGEPKRGQENSDRRLTDAEICKNFNISEKEAVGKVRLIEKEVGRKSISENDGIAWIREGQEEREGRGEQGRGSREQWGKLTPQLGSFWSPPPPTLNCRRRSFLFLFVFAREHGSLPKNSGPNQGRF